MAFFGRDERICIKRCMGQQGACKVFGMLVTTVDTYVYLWLSQNSGL